MPAPRPRARKPLASGSRIGYLGTMPSTAYRYLVNLSGVCGGTTIIEGTRIGVHDVIGLLQNGETVDSVCSAHCLPGLTKAQVYECLAYYEDHRTEIDALVVEQMNEPIA